MKKSINILLYGGAELQRKELYRKIGEKNMPQSLKDKNFNVYLGRRMGNCLQIYPTKKEIPNAMESFNYDAIVWDPCNTKIERSLTNKTPFGKLIEKTNDNPYLVKILADSYYFNESLKDKGFIPSINSGGPSIELLFEELGNK